MNGRICAIAGLHGEDRPVCGFPRSRQMEDSGFVRGADGNDFGGRLKSDLARFVI